MRKKGKIRRLDQGAMADCDNRLLANGKTIISEASASVRAPVFSPASWREHTHLEQPPSAWVLHAPGCDVVDQALDGHPEVRGGGVLGQLVPADHPGEGLWNSCLAHWKVLGGGGKMDRVCPHVWAKRQSGATMRERRQAGLQR